MFKLAVIIDAQYDFMKPAGSLFVPGADAVIPTLNEYLKSLTLDNGYVGVVLTADAHDPETYPESLEAMGNPETGKPGFPPHCYIGTDGYKFAIDVSLIPAETKKLILNKDVNDMWEEKNIVLNTLVLDGEPAAFGGEQKRDAFFQRMFDQGIDEIELTGVAADFCVKDAIRGFVKRGFNVTLFDNLTAGVFDDIRKVVNTNFAGKNVTVL
jgi:nicotinamidase/pyrazinamidase